MRTDEPGPDPLPSDLTDGEPDQGGLLMVPIATALIAADGCILHWSADAQSLLGYSPDEAVGAKAAQLLVTEAQRPEVQALFRGILEGRAWSGIFPVLHRNGHHVNLEFRTHPVLGPEGRPLVLAVASDVTAVHRLRADLAVLDGFFTQSPVGMAVYDPELRFVRLNEALARTNGLPVDAQLGRRVTEVLPGINGTEIEAVMRRVLETGEAVIDARSHGRTPGDPGQDRAWSASYFRLERPGGGVLGVSSTIVDVTARYRAESEAARYQQRLALLNEASTRIGTTLDLARTAQELAEVAAPGLADTVVVEVLDSLARGESAAPPSPADRSAVLRRMAFHTVPGSAMTPLAAVDSVHRYPPSAPYAWALAHRRPVLLPAVEGSAMHWFSDTPQLTERMRAEGVRSLMVVPLIARGAAVGVAAFYRNLTERRYDAEDLALAGELAARAAVAVDNALLYTRERDAARQRQQALEEAHAAQQRLLLLNEASTRIGTTLDLHRTARELVEVVLPRFADFVTVDLLESVLEGEEPAPPPDDGPAMLRAVAVGEVQGSVVMAGAADPVGEASKSAQLYAESLRTRRSILVTQVDEAALHRIVAAPDRVAPSLAAGVHSYLMVPLLARGVVLGGAEFIRTGTTPEPFTEDDVALAEELAARAAVCMDNARLYRRERETALTLQRSLLPQEVHRTLGLELAHRYLPSSAISEVGGDWFDVVPLSGGRVALIVGDVMGHGIRAAATMGQLRTVARTLATLELEPSRVLRRLDEAAAALGEGQFATCVCVLYDPLDRSCSAASAGHLPPVIATPDGTAELLELPSGAPLGVGGVPFESRSFTLPEDGILVLYTDGLVERRGRDLDAGLDLLRRTVADRRPTLEETCDAVLTALDAPAGQDDVAVLMAQVRPLGADRFAVLPLAEDHAMVGHARRFVRRTLTDWGLPALVDPAELLTSELITNALVHAGSPVELRILRDHLLTIEVADVDSRPPRLRHAREADEGGRGMYLVNELAHRWGSRATDEGKVVWYELEPPPG
ncbi:SpoIIE family protein phosphatase [Kitasatospora sp. NPDC101801]|uniref:SpoIIE family protein phosphatase n=1 Tax=Kitasatospora sp. NPDC101801 TaxID=3364103 RepID=UPI0037FCDC57